MSRNLALFLLASALSATAASTQPRPENLAGQVELAVQLAEYPLPETRLREVIGDWDLPLVREGKDEKGREYAIRALSDPSAKGGFYAVRIVYEMSSTRHKSEARVVELVEYLYLSWLQRVFVSERCAAEKAQMPELRATMKQKHLLPIEFADQLLTYHPYGDPEK